MVYPVKRGDYIKVLLFDGMVFEGEVVQVENGYVIIDDVCAFGDWVCIEIENIIDMTIL